MNQQSNRTILYTIIVLLVIIIILGVFYINSVRVTAPTVNTITETPVATTSTSVSPSASVSPTSSTPVTSVNQYYIAVGQPGNAPVGCGDGIVAVSTQIPPTSAPLSAAISTLLANKSAKVGQYANTLSASNLKLDSAVVTNGVATVKISGTVSLGGVCDSPRVIEQIKRTVLQFPTITSANITVNGQPLEKIGSEQ